jgi:hypothetical protein
LLCRRPRRARPAWQGGAGGVPAAARLLIGQPLVRLRAAGDHRPVPEARVAGVRVHTAAPPHRRLSTAQERSWQSGRQSLRSRQSLGPSAQNAVGLDHNSQRAGAAGTRGLAAPFEEHLAEVGRVALRHGPAGPGGDMDHHRAARRPLALCGLGSICAARSASGKVQRKEALAAGRKVGRQQARSGQGGTLGTAAVRLRRGS